MLTKTRPEMPVVGMTVVANQIEDIGAAASKAIRSDVRYRYSQKVLYTLSDGTQFSTTVRALTKPKLQQKLDSTARHIEQRQLFAEQYQDGDSVVWYTSWRAALSLR